MTPHASPPTAHQILRLADLTGKKPTRFLLQPKGNALKAIGEDLSLLALRKLRFEGHIKPLGNSDWQLEASIGATVEQPCVVTLKPVTTRIDQNISRTFLAGLVASGEDEEVEMPEDDSVEALSDEIDLGAMMIEALSLVLPLYPRSDTAVLENAVFTEPGKTPMTDEETRPFAGLAGLRDQLKKNGD